MTARASAQRFEYALARHLRQQLGAPLGAIGGFIEMLMEDARGRDAEDLLPDLERMRLAGQELGALLDRLAEHIDAQPQDQGRIRHDLRTPLNAIKGYGELLVEEARDEWPETFVADLTRVVALADTLLGEIDAIFSPPGDAAAEPVEAVRAALLAVRPLEPAEVRLTAAIPSRVLVVDDNVANRDLLARRLEREGQQVESAEGGEAALDLLGREDFDLVLLDLMMPGMSGFEVLCRMKASEDTRHVPVIMISALDEIDSAVRCIEAGAEDYLPKPFDPVLLRARIGASLEKKRLRDREMAILAELRSEKERSEALLLNILPGEIVARMRCGETVIADRFDDATILFSDLVDFTTLAADLSPERTVALLGRIFASFDDLATRHGLEKIKTLGDGYMVAGGLPNPRRDHAAAAAEMGCAMIEAVSTAREHEGLPLALRVGLHSGAVIAGVIGTHKFVYDVWGDTVNTAKRMESYGMPGVVHISAATRAALGPGFRCVPRGPIEVKGKGLMETFFLETAARDRVTDEQDCE